MRASEFLNKLAEGADSLSYIGNCTDDDVIEHIFGDATHFAQAVDEHGDEFALGDLVVKYDPETDVHSFYSKNQGLVEAPLTDYVPLGNFDKPGPFRSKVDKKLITHPVTQLKTAKFFEKTPYDFRLFFSNIPGTAKRTELGATSPEEVREIFGDVAEQIITGSDDAITVVFLGNYGDRRVMITPWIMAHRIGHAIQSSRIDQWRTVEHHFFKAINEKLAEVYGRAAARDVFSYDIDYRRSAEYNALFNAIGTQRSSREGEIRRPYEFMYEMFAQYIKTGTVTLNPFPAQLGYGRHTWGNQSQMKARGDTDLQQAAETLGYDMQLLFGDVLSMCVGQIFLM